MCLWMLLLTNILSVTLSMTNELYVCFWPISVRGMHMSAPWFQLTNYSNYSASVSLAITLLIVMHSTCMVPLSGG